MKERYPTIILILVSLVALVATGLEIALSKDEHIYIRPDGTVEYGYVNGSPPPVNRNGDLYTLTGDAGNFVIHRGNIILDGNGFRIGGDPGVSISTVSNVTVRNARVVWGKTGISSSGNSLTTIINNQFFNNVIGINLTNCQSSLVKGNILSNNGWSIHLSSGCINTVIEENAFLDNNGQAIYALGNCDNSQIFNNNITGGITGIYADKSSKLQIFKNRITNQRIGIELYSSNNTNLYLNIFENCGLEVWNSFANNVTSNTVNGKPLVYLENISDRVVEEAGQVILIGCSNIRVENSNLSCSTYGIFLGFSTNNTVVGNNITGNSIGIYLVNSTGNSIVNNEIGLNNQGLTFWHASQNFIYHNTISDNAHKIGLWYSSGNVWDNGYRSGGNYWGSNYTGTDLKRGLFQNQTGSDGLSDTVHVIDNNNQDNYPLIFPWHEPPWTPVASFSCYPVQSKVNMTVIFDAWNSYDFDGEIVNYLWDFGDGITRSEMNAVTNHSYTYPRFYNITLIVIDNEGLNSTTTKSVDVTKIDSNIALYASKSTVILRQNTTLSGSLTPTRAQAEVYVWHKFGASSNWTNLANLTTDSDGEFFLNWTPLEIGSHLLKCNWTGDDWTFPSETTTLVVTCTRIPTSISISTSCSSALNGFKVAVEGTLLEIYGNSLESETIVLSYIFAGIGTWTPFTSDMTDNLGNYDIVWFPPATGYFLLKAEWAGDSLYVGADNTIAVSTTFEDQYVFTVESNSTVSDLSFDTASRRLTFTASGENGTAGYTRVTVAKSLLSDIALLEVLVDGVEYNYTSTETDDSWVIFLTYNHSSHFIVIELNLPTQNILVFLLSTLLLIVAVVAVSVVLVRRQRRRNKTLS